MLSAPFIYYLLKMQCASIPNFRLNIVFSFQLVNFTNQLFQINQFDQKYFLNGNTKIFNAYLSAS
tara:strand:- start:11289 stop:11483 length:195 start_codon:yes stop_codon:yes gene_type:complete